MECSLENINGYACLIINTSQNTEDFIRNRALQFGKICGNLGKCPHKHVTSRGLTWRSGIFSGMESPPGT